MANTQKPIKAVLDRNADDSCKTQKPIVVQLDEIPTPEAGDAGKALVVNESEDGFELATVGGGSDLPVVTAEDDCKILQVVGGEWTSGDKLFIKNILNVSSIVTAINTVISDNIMGLLSSKKWTSLEVLNVPIPEDIFNFIQNTDSIEISALIGCSARIPMIIGTSYEPYFEFYQYNDAISGFLHIFACLSITDPSVYETAIYIYVRYEEAV